MTGTQFAILERINREGRVLGANIPTKTREAMLAHGWIEECARMYFGPREWAFKITTKGRNALKAARARRATILEKGTKR